MFLKRRPWGTEAQIADIAVAPEGQGKEVDTALLEKAMATAQRLGMEVLLLEVRVSNGRVYTRHLRQGFRVVRHLPGYHRVAPGRWEDGWADRAVPATPRTDVSSSPFGTAPSRGETPDATT